MRRYFVITGLSLAALSVAGCGSTSSSSSASAADRTGSMACTHWANVKGDIKAGILTDAELRAKVSEVRGSASSPAVEAAATKLLGAITSGNDSDLTTSYAALNKACS